jgi:hypothetical protein
MTNQTVYPTPLPGYQPATRFEYPRNALQLVAVGLIIGVTPLLLLITWLLQGRPASLPLAVSNGLWDLSLVLATIIVTVIIHEGIHGLVYQLFGYKVSYGASLHLFAAYAGAFGQWQRRDHNIVVALAPLILLTLLLIPLLSLAQPVLVLIAFTALLFNIGGAVGDMYLAWYLWRLPRTTLLYDIDAATMLIFLPAHDEPSPAS